MSDEPVFDPHLSFASFDQIVEELGKRSRCLVVGMVIDARSASDDHNLKFRTLGGACGAIGICRVVEKSLLDDFFTAEDLLKKDE